MSNSVQTALGWSAGEESGAEPVLAPMMKHYLELKKRYAEYLLLFQVGDFYEVFFEDAKTVSSALNIRLTSRDKNHPNPVPMCGVPIHAIEAHLAKLVGSGHSCVLISQVEETLAKKGPAVRREVTRIVTPGIRYEGDGLDEKRFNYLAAVLFTYAGGAVCGVDVSTGLLRVQEVEQLDDLLEAVARLRPAEILLPHDLDRQAIDRHSRWYRECRRFGEEIGARFVQRSFATVSVKQLQKALGEAAALADLRSEGRAAVDAVLRYVEEVSCGRGVPFAEIRVEDRRSSLFLDAATRRNLELAETRLDGDRRNSLLGRIDYTETAMGSRALGEWVLAPSCDLEEIRRRHDAVEELVRATSRREALREHFRGMRDIDRIVSRVTGLRASARDLLTLAESLTHLPPIVEIVAPLRAALFAPHRELDPLSDIAERLREALVDDPPAKINEGGMFRPGYNAELDDLRRIASEGREYLARLEQQERERTGIPGLKVRYNSVFGYFIEVTKSHLSKIPAEYERKQTLANAERFVTPELKDFEVRILSARGRQIEMERELFVELRSWVAQRAARIQHSSRALAQLDALAAFAELAARHNYTRPVMHSGTELVIRSGRHPVIERVIGEENFVPNDTYLNGEDRRFAVLTGPNMGGKSTYLRQVGLIQLLAQAGSFVPAAEANLGLVDRIFTRIGAADDIARGDSTFMVEMKEAAVIVKKAGARSLVLIDEIGRGTATTDGLAIAEAVAEWLHDTIRCRTIFATHFHELTSLPERRDGAFCLSVGVVEHGETIEFTHRIENRAADRSYGIEVARLAGLPDGLVLRAQQLLAPASGVLKDSLAVERTSLPLRQEAIFDELREIDCDGMRPVDALIYLTKIKKMVEMPE